MKIIVDRKQFSQAFSTVAQFAPARHAQEVLTHVRLSAENDKATLTATDCERGISVVVPVEIDEPGVVLLPTGQVATMLRESEDDKLVIKATAKGLEVIGERSKAKLPTVNADEFPPFAAFDAPTYATIQAGTFRELLRQASFATDFDASRYALGSVKLEIAPDELTVISLDGRRCVFAPAPCKAPEKREALVPRGFIDRIVAALPTDGEVDIAIRNSDVLLRCGDATIYARQCEGRHPRFRDCVPGKDSSKTLETTAGAFSKAVRQASLVLSDESRQLDFSAADGTLSIKAKTDRGQTEVELPVRFSGPQVESRLNHLFVLQWLKTLDSDAPVAFMLNDDKATLFSSGNSNYVVMPLSKER